MARCVLGRLARSAVSATLVALACGGIWVATAGLAGARPARPTVGFGGPTLDLPPINSDGTPSSQRTQNLPIAIRLSADRQRIAELDWALFSHCNFDARADWGRLTDVPIAPDGTFAIHEDVATREGLMASLDVSGKVDAGSIKGSTSFELADQECGAGVTWTATPAFVGTTSQGAPAVLQLARDRRQIARFMLVWISRPRECLEVPENVLGIDQRHVARLKPSGRFSAHRAAKVVQTTSDAVVTREALSGRIVPGRAAGALQFTVRLGSGPGAFHCRDKRVAYSLGG